jgi:hypothetical protein
MADKSCGSVTVWIEFLKAGNHAAPYSLGTVARQIEIIRWTWVGEEAPAS